LRTCLNVALGIQNAAPIPYAREFSDIYEYKVTAKSDEVEVWEDFADEEAHLKHTPAEGTRPFRKTKRVMKKGGVFDNSDCR